MRWFILILLLFSIRIVSAQNSWCVDSTHIYPYFDCSAQPQYYPICGCDKKTYRNLCEGQNRHGIRSYTDGPCSGFEFDIRPNLVSYVMNFTLVQSGNPNFARLFIIDTYGRTWIMQELTASSRLEFTIDVSSLMYGVYFIYVYDTKGTYRYTRFVRVPG